MENMPARISFTEEEERSGQDALEQMGILEGTPFVCFAARDTAYLSSIYPDYDFRYHNYRNSNINNYLDAARAMVERGYYAIRMGSARATKMDATDSKIIDYAGSNFRSDFLDIYLAAKCQIFIGSADGITGMPMIFRRPINMVNFIPLGDLWVWSDNYVCIPKKLWLQLENRFMTFSEIFNSDVRGFVYANQYEQLGIDVVENTSAEIAAVAIELEARLNGTWETTEEDEELQKQFWSVYRSNYISNVLKSRIGARFLRENRNLLDKPATTDSRSTT
jgi:putative glycosyltransferase (TIGR04372 family)